MYQIFQHLEPVIGHVATADVGLDGAEREICALRLGRADTVEKG
jgi:hypothetical protein